MGSLRTVSEPTTPSFDLGPDHLELREWVHRFAADVVRPADGVPDPTLRDEVVQLAFRRGLLLLGCGEAALRLCPPLCVSAAQVQLALTLLDGVLATLGHGAWS